MQVRKENYLRYDQWLTGFMFIVGKPAIHNISQCILIRPGKHT